MAEQFLPLFPLKVVLFPDTALPLHIFEERYKEMIGEVIESNGEFGVLCATDNTVASRGLPPRGWPRRSAATTTAAWTS